MPQTTFPRYSQICKKKGEGGGANHGFLDQTAITVFAITNHKLRMMIAYLGKWLHGGMHMRVKLSRYVILRVGRESLEGFELNRFFN